MVMLNHSNTPFLAKRLTLVLELTHKSYFIPLSYTQECVDSVDKYRFWPIFSRNHCG